MFNPGYVATFPGDYVYGALPRARAVAFLLPVVDTAVAVVVVVLVLLLSRAHDFGKPN